METQTETTTESRKPVATTRSGSIGCSIWKNATDDGREYHVFTISRAWKTQAGDKSGYAPNYFGGNRDDLHKAIDAACDEIAKLDQSLPNQSGQ